MTCDEIIKMALECGYWSGQTVEMNDVGLERFAAMVAAHTENGNQARKVSALRREIEAGDRNLCQLTDELAKTVALLRQAWAVIRWQCFGECRTEGVDGLPTPSEVDIAIRQHLNKSKQ